jgi:hypothetical protein
MHDHFNEIFEWDEIGNKRRKRVARDRERITFATISDQSARFSATFADGTPDHTSPHKPGHRFLDVDDAARQQADQAYEERRERVHYATNRRHQQQDETRDQHTPAPTKSLDQLRQTAETAYAERNKRLQNAWRH